MNYAAIGRKNRPMTGAVPSSVGVIPSHDAAFVSARCGDSVGGPIISFPYRDFASAKIHHATATWLDLVEAMHQRLAIATLVEFSGTLRTGS